MPGVLFDGPYVCLFELDRDAHRQRVVPNGVQADEEPPLKVHAKNDREIDASDVHPKWMFEFAPRSLPAVPNLQPVLVGWPALDWWGVQRNG